ncbi:SDR family oxidoreductase [Silanimonas sp.]|uniref:SDR family oxidoreductase n=1 Tax=Silanimonas sp. TaxID=1929290 RepID=UPI0022C100FA|nr:SDR family oxidoreductase [Silanimonas sp.]MCZ8116052.1 SDR family oxidoreductase [Silanimonas sp.]
MNGVAGRGVLLTGASGGIGQCLALRLAEAGATVYAVGRRADALHALAARARPGAIRPVVADLATADGIDAVRRAVAAAPIPMSLLILGAADSRFGLFEHSSVVDVQAQVATNLVAPMLLVRALLPCLMRLPEAGVVGIGSTFGSLGYPGFAAYSASKFGLRGFLEALAREHADTALRVQYLSPRATRTALNSPAVEAMNAELGVAVDDADRVAATLLAAIESGTRRRQLGWPERLFARLNGALPELVDRALAKQLPTVRRFARAAAPLASDTALESRP